MIQLLGGDISKNPKLSTQGKHKALEGILNDPELLDK
jgi:hypothetical protein